MFNSLNRSFRAADLRPLLIALAAFVIPAAAAQQLPPNVNPGCRCTLGSVDDWRGIENQNPLCVTYFKRQIKREKDHSDRSSSTALAQIALGKMGDPQTLQQLACIPQTGDTNQQSRLVSYQLPRVGGAFTIRLYLRLFDWEDEFGAVYMKERERQNAGDVSNGGISGSVNQGLLEVLPDRPSSHAIEIAEGGTPRTYDQRNTFVRKWAIEHESEWKELEPRGEGIDYSGNSCPLPKLCKPGSDRVLCGIAQGHLPSIIAAGRSGGRKYIPSLSNHVARGTDPWDHVTGYIAEEALARLDDKQTLQKLVCEASGDYRTQQLLLFKLPEVGGAFAVRMYQRLLKSDDSYRAAAIKAGESPGYVSGRIAADLAQLLPGAPERYLQGPNDRDRLVAFWMAWLQDNRSRWETLKPLGEGIDYSGAWCGRKH
jgi:hypothetical protein